MYHFLFLQLNGDMMQQTRGINYMKNEQTLTSILNEIPKYNPFNGLHFVCHHARPTRPALSSRPSVARQQAMEERLELPEGGYPRGREVGGRRHSGWGTLRGGGVNLRGLKVKWVVLYLRPQ